MLLEDLISEDKKEGAYVACKFSDASADALYTFAEKLGVDNIVPRTKYHITVIYSTVPVPKTFKAKGDFDEPLLVQPNHLTIFPTREGNGALVVELYSAELKKRHKELMEKYKLQYGFPEYKVHTTLSYDVGDFEIDDSISLKPLKDLEIVEEYYEPLDLDWAKKNT